MRLVHSTRSSRHRTLHLVRSQHSLDSTSTSKEQAQVRHSKDYAPQTAFHPPSVLHARGSQRAHTPAYRHTHAHYNLAHLTRPSAVRTSPPASVQAFLFWPSNPISPPTTGWPLGAACRPSVAVAVFAALAQYCSRTVTSSRPTIVPTPLFHCGGRRVRTAHLCARTSASPPCESVFLHRDSSGLFRPLPISIRIGKGKCLCPCCCCRSCRSCRSCRCCCWWWWCSVILEFIA